MREMTNVHGISDKWLALIKRHEHKGAKYSASMLCNSARQTWLAKRHADEVVEDAMDRVWATVGTSVHEALHAHAGPNELSEEYMDEIVPGLPVSGTFDLFLGNGTLRDHKTTSVFSILYNSRIAEWTAQCNVYALGLTKRGFTVKALEIEALLRDYREGEKERIANYPECMLVIVPIELWTPEKQEAFLRERVALFDAHEKTDDSELPLCTDEERWARDGKPPKKCDLYCDGVAFCDQRQAELKAKANEPAPVKRGKKGA